MSAANSTEKLPSLSDGDSLEDVSSRRTYGADPGPLASRYIQACHSQSWSFAHWSKTNEAEPVKWQPMRCCSWRHEGPCQRFRAAQDYARIARALEGHNREHVVYLVLTLDPSAWTGDGWLGFNGETPPRRMEAKGDYGAIAAAYDALGDRWTIFANAVRRRFGKFHYVSTVESHKNGWPHLNAIIVSEELSNFAKVAALNLEGWDKNAKGRKVAQKVFGTMLESAGFGPIAFLEPADRKKKDGDQLAGYIAKLAGSASTPWDGQGKGLLDGQEVSSLDGQAIAEVVKYSQTPTRAPKNFRRIRSSKGFLPPIEKDPDRTGGIFDAEGKPIGSLVCDDILEDAKSSDIERDKQRIMARIGEELAKLDMRQTWVNDEDGKLFNKQNRIIKTLLHAARIMHGEDVDAWRSEAKEIDEKIGLEAWKALVRKRKRAVKQAAIDRKNEMKARGIGI